jgi:hypothetical protein
MEERGHTGRREGKGEDISIAGERDNEENGTKNLQKTNTVIVHYVTSIPVPLIAIISPQKLISS